MTDHSSKFSRRRFLSTAATGLAATGLAGLTPVKSWSQQEKAAKEKDRGKIITRTLGRTGYELPVVSMGVLSGSHPEIMIASYEAGMRHFNTSAAYQFGRNEQMVGGVVERLNVRDKMVIATGTNTWPQLRGLGTDEIVKKLSSGCDASLRRLRTDYIDIFYIHEIQDAGTVGHEGIIRALKVLKEQKKIRFTGIATHSNMAEVIDAVADGGFYDVVLTAINFTMSDDTVLLKAIDTAAAKGVGIIAMKMLAGGTRWPNPQARKNYSSSTIATALLKWVMRNENICTCVPGYTNYEHMTENFSIAYDLEYNEQEKKLLSDNNVKLGLEFCRQCRKCLASCPEDVDIPTLMRTHMYASQYGTFDHARETLHSIPEKSGLAGCTDCSVCVAKCANTVDIARRIDELKMIYG